MKKLYTTIILLFALCINAQDGILDTAFGANGKIDITVPLVSDMEIDSNGKIIIAGSDGQDAVIYRFNPDGTPDNSFGINGLKTIDFGTVANGVQDIALTASNDIFVTFNYYGNVAKLSNIDGSFDTTFGNNGVWQIHADYYHESRIAIDNTNKIVISSYDLNSSTNPFYNTRIYRLIFDGQSDITWNSGFYQTYSVGFSEAVYINAIKIQSDNKILVSGTDPLNVPYANIIVRYNINGTLDSTFNASPTGFSSDSQLNNMELNGNSIFAVGGNSYSGVGLIGRIIKYTNTGTKDVTFDTDGILNVNYGSYYYNVPYGVCFQPDNKILMVANTRLSGNSEIKNISVTRINIDGTIDSSFGTNGYTNIPTLFSNVNFRTYSKINPINGKLYVAGFSNTNTLSIYRFTTGILSNTENKTDKSPILFPNPTNSIVNIKTDAILKSIKITDILGRVKVINDFANNQIDVSNFANGVHFMEINTDMGFYKEKFIKQ